MQIRHLAGCVILKDNKILLLHRKKYDWYELPGGGIEEHETPQQAATRELKEELNADIEIIKKLDEKTFVLHSITFNYNWFLGKILNEEKVAVMETHTFDEYKYIPLNDLPNYHLSPNMQNFYKEFQSGNILLQ